MRADVFAAFVDELGRMTKTARVEIPPVNPRSLTPAGVKLLRQHAGEGPWDELDLEEALAHVDARRQGEYQRKPIGDKDLPGPMPKLRRVLGAGDRKAI